MRWQLLLHPQHSSSHVGFLCNDYHLATASMAALARSEYIYKTVKFSDHAPITVDYEFDL